MLRWKLLPWNFSFTALRLPIIDLSRVVFAAKVSCRRCVRNKTTVCIHEQIVNASDSDRVFSSVRTSHQIGSAVAMETDKGVAVRCRRTATAMNKFFGTIVSVASRRLDRTALPRMQPLQPPSAQTNGVHPHTVDADVSEAGWVGRLSLIHISEPTRPY